MAFDESRWSKITSTKQVSALRQIEAAIAHLEAGAFECAATLALAAEGQIAATDRTYLWQRLMALAGGKASISRLNDLRDWLKHLSGSESREISEFEVAIGIVRAITKYNAAYPEKTPAMERFAKWFQAKLAA